MSAVAVLLTGLWLCCVVMTANDWWRGKVMGGLVMLILWAAMAFVIFCAPGLIGAGLLGPWGLVLGVVVSVVFYCWMESQ